MFTANRVQAAPVTVSQGAPRARAAAGGRRSTPATRTRRRARRARRDARATAAEAGAAARPRARAGARPLDRRDRRAAAARPAARRASRTPPRRSRADGGAAAAEAILTTDTRAKEAVAHGAGFTVGGMAKGSGMIHPNLATMLAVVTTDYPLEPGEAIEFLRPAVDESFNAISVDGECSTNDTVVLLANGASGIERTPATDAAFAAALRDGLRRARQADRRRRRGRDGARRDRGHRRRVRRRGEGDRARAIATSPLVKTALFGHDANWGRVLAAAGSAPFNGGYAQLDPELRHARLSTARRVLVARRAARRRARRSRARRCTIELDLGLGDGARELPDERPVLRLRPHQRGLPLVSRIVVKCRRRGRRRARRRDRSSSSRRARGLRRARRRPADLARRWSAAGSRSQFVGGRRVTTPRGARGRAASRCDARQRRALRGARAARGRPARRRDRPRGASTCRRSGSSATRSRARPRAIERRARGRARSRSSRRSRAGPLNVNADEAAAALAVGLEAERILFLTDVPGLLLGGAVAARRSPRTRPSGCSTPASFEGGIVPKLRAAVTAARLGVRAEIGATAVVA